MGVYRKGYCPQCKKWRISEKGTNCKKCGSPLRMGEDWYIDYYSAPKRRKREKIGTSKALAEQTLKKREVAIAEGRFLNIRKEQRVKFEDFADQYIENHSKPNNRSWKKSESYNLKRLKQFFAGKYLSEITPFEVQKFKSERQKESSPATANRGLTLLKSIFNKATAWGKFEGKNPVKGIKFFKEQARLRFLEKEEIVRFLENCSEHLRPIAIVALNTGMRKGEILGIKWNDIDFRRGIIHLYNTKNGEERAVPMNKAVKRTLIAVRKHPESPYVFCDEKGNRYGECRKSFFTACKNAGIINFRFHDLRHTFASQLVMAGVDLNTVRELLGHKSLEMTLRYSHLSPDHKQRAVAVLESQMDTIWTPKPLVVTEEKIDLSQVFENKELVNCGPLAQLVERQTLNL